MFFVARALAAGDAAERNASWNRRLAVPRFHQVMRRLTAVWGTGTLAHAALSATMAFILPASVALILELIIAVATLAALLAWTRGVQSRGTNPNL
jgi:hypothetical protein